MKGDCSGSGNIHHLLIKKFDPKISIAAATLEDCPTIANMARFYAYDLSRWCACISHDWSFPEDGMYESFDPKPYFFDPTRHAYLVRVYDELAGFVLINKEILSQDTHWNMGEFYITAKFQGTGVAQSVAHQMFEKHQGLWEVAVIPQNNPAKIFWEKAICQFTDGIFHQSIKDVTYDEHQPKRIVFTFDSRSDAHKLIAPKVFIRPSILEDIEGLVSLSKKKRLAYEKAQPRFWRYAGPDAEKSQTQWFTDLLSHKDYIILTATDDNLEILGFIIGQLTRAPEVYNPGGLTLTIDDFCVQTEDLWHSVGEELLKNIKREAKNKGVVQVLVVAGAHDIHKRQFLMNQNLSIASQWFLGEIR
jgi:predicted acetyltransferase